MRQIHPEDIKARIRKKYGSLVNFEIAKGLKAETARDVLRGRSVRRTAQAMAEVLGVSVDVILGPKKRKRASKKIAQLSTKRDSKQLEGAN